MSARILYVHNSADIYGASRSLVRLLRTLDRTRFQPVVLLPAEGLLAQHIRAEGVQVLIDRGLSVIDRSVFKSWRVAGFFLNIPRSIFAIWRLLKRERIDLVHTNTGVILSPGPAAWLAGVPHVWHLRDWFQEFPGFWRGYEKWMRAFSTRILAVSTAIAEQFTERAKVEVVHNGFDLEEFPLPPKDVAAEFRSVWKLGDGPVIGCVGRIKLQRKGQEILLRAAALLHAQGVRAKYLIVGAPFPGNESHLAELQRIAREARMEEDVIFTGELADPRGAYAAMNIFVLPSAQPEPFGGVVMEAMCLGLPVVATALGGSLEQVAEGETGYLVSPGDPQALAAKLQALLGNPELRERLGKAGRERIATRFCLREMTQRISAIYEACLRQS